MQYYVAKNRQPIGPYSLDQLRSMVAARELEPSQLCWAEGQTNWEPLGTILGIPKTADMATPTVTFASFPKRALATMIDWLLLGLINQYAAQLFYKNLPQFEKAQTLEELSKMATAFYQQTAPLQMAFLIATWLFIAIMESSKRQATPGKLVCGLIVTDLGGNRISFLRASGRFFTKNFLSLGLLSGFGCLTMLVTPRRQTLHDLLAGTLVLRRGK